METILKKTCFTGLFLTAALIPSVAFTYANEAPSTDHSFYNTNTTKTHRGSRAPTMPPKASNKEINVTMNARGNRGMPAATLESRDTDIKLQTAKHPRGTRDASSRNLRLTAQ